MKTFRWKILAVHISAQNIDCEFLLELPHQDGSNEYPQSMFLSRNKKNNVYPCKPQFYYIKVVFKRVKIIQACYSDETRFPEEIRNTYTWYSLLSGVVWSGPSCSKLTMLLVNDLLKFILSDTQICWNFLLKKMCSAKVTHIFSTKNIRILYIEPAKTVNEMTFNKLVKLTMLWTTGPRPLNPMMNTTESHRPDKCLQLNYIK